MRSRNGQYGLVAEVRLRRYQRLLVGSRNRVKKLWSDAAESRSVFGQNVAGGTAHIVVRQSISTGLESWWQSDSFSSAVMHGAEGMGKTCAAVQWAQSRLEALRILAMQSAHHARKYGEMQFPLDKSAGGGTVDNPADCTDSLRCRKAALGIDSCFSNGSFTDFPPIN